MTGATHQSPSVVFPNTTVVTTEASVRPPADASVVTSLSNTPEASGTARKAPSGPLFGGSSRNDSSRLDSNSGDGLGIHEPGSMTRGGDTVATAPSGRACLHAKCPAVTGSLSGSRRTNGVFVSPEYNLSVLSPSGAENVAAAPDSAPSPQGVVATPISNPTSRMCASVTSATLDPSQPVSLAGSGVAAFCRSSLSKGEQDQASEQKAEAGCGDCEVPLGRIDLVTHDAPLNSAPPIDADELIKAFGIPASRSACHFGTPSCPQVSVVADDAAARQPSLGTSLDLPAASSGVAGLSDGVPAIDPRVEAMISELESRGFFVAEMKTVTLRTIAASESVSKSTSLVKA